MKKKIAIHWFRQDLRLSDNPALAQAGKHKSILPIYILDDKNAGEYAMGGASRWWLHHSLNSLNKSLDGKLSVYRGSPQHIFDDILARFDVEDVYWNRCYEPWRINRDRSIKEHLETKGIAVHISNGSLLWEPWDVQKGDGTPYRVFTPFYRKGCLKAEKPRAPLPKPGGVNYLFDQDGTGIDALGLLPTTDWHSGLDPHWTIGEKSAHHRLKAFISKGLPAYKDGRDIPAKPYVSRLSPHLHFGEISPNRIWHAVRNMGDNEHVDRFCCEMGWREFSYNLLYHNPELPRKNLQPKFDAFPWTKNTEYLRAWQKGQTGVPMVDAGMRELWQTGYMHNRTRMIVGSFLVKNLRLHWHHGERWFWDTLVDADLADNSANWQWIAGCGADAAPYFRIFNPVTQGKNFDPDGSYVRKYIPEIAALPDKYLFSPWEAPKPVLKEAGVELETTYPKPVVDLKQSRKAALEAFRSLKQGES
ncbi:MAG: deoxyribodipyrimidine photo-lyase [Hyphomicrobiales bacterium]|nr:deoxyribodipyrimidine photo-lyase [Hyphomicrobiales bacterium]MCY4052548.1 deoxyribodipyrimidine photo-lyase [Hyphomicrobiales bacterium]